MVSLDNSERTTLGSGFFLGIAFFAAHIFIRHLLAKRIQKACIRADVYKLSPTFRDVLCLGIALYANVRALGMIHTQLEMFVARLGFLTLLTWGLLV